MPMAVMLPVTAEGAVGRELVPKSFRYCAFRGLGTYMLQIMR